MRQVPPAQAEREPGAVFKPFGIDSYGVLGKQASELIDIAGKHAEELGLESSQAFRARAHAELLFALHKGNAFILATGAKMARSRP